MADKKLSPRQKMIGMMYLVLTALLALNVSKEILEAFVLVERSLAKTTDNFNEKNRSVYGDFDAAAAQLERAVPWRDKAYLVKKAADGLYARMEDLKKDIVRKADGAGYDMRNISSKDDRDVPSEVMIFSGRGFELKEEIAKYSDLLTGFIRPGDDVLRRALLSNLSTKDPDPHPEHGTLSWEQEHFESMPLVAVITMLTKIQNDVRNAEFDVINYLKKEINTETIPFNRVAGTVIAPTNYIVQGDSFRADIFLAAFDTTQAPAILVGNYDTVSSGVYRMRGAYDSVAVHAGMGRYSVRGDREGFHRWGGLIRLKTESGSREFPFHGVFQVAKPAMVVSAEKMNVLYQYLDNPLAISVPGIPADKVRPSISAGQLVPQGNGRYVARVTGGSEAKITVMAEISPGEMKNMGTMTFRVKRVPLPVAKVAGRTEGKIRKNEFCAQAGVAAVLEDFLFDGVRYVVTEFEMIVAGAGKTPRPIRSDSYKFTDEMRKNCNQLIKGDQVFIQGIKAVGPGNKTVSLSPVALEII